MIYILSNYFKRGIYLKALNYTRGILLALLIIVVVSSLMGIWVYGVMIAGFALVCAMFWVNNIEWFAFGMSYIKGSTYFLIAIISFSKLFVSGISGFGDNAEFFLIGIVSGLEAIHNLHEWYGIVKKM